MVKKQKETNPSDVFSGALNILGIKIDLGELLSSPEGLEGRLDELREKLKEVGGKEVLSDEEWSKGGASITGHFRTRGLLGDQEFHVGTMGKPEREVREPSVAQPQEVIEPPVDVFYEKQRVIIVADVPGVSMDDLELKIKGKVFYLSTRATARRSYRKEVPLEAEVVPESLQTTCRNGVLEVRLHKQGAKNSAGRSKGS